MDQQRDVERAAVDALLDDLGGDGKLAPELAALDLAQGRDRLDGVLVHRVVVIHVELHHRHHAPEGGDERAEHADLVHQPQRPFRVVVAEQQLEKDAVGVRVGPELVVHERQVRRDQPQRVGMDRRIGGQALLEQAQDVDRIGEEERRIGHVEPAVLEHVARRRAVLAEGEDVADRLAEARALLHVARLEPGEEDAGEIADVLGLGEVVLHEPLDPALAGGRGVAEGRRDLDLGVEGELFGGPRGQEVEVHAGHPQEGLGLGEDPVLLRG